MVSVTRTEIQWMIDLLNDGAVKAEKAREKAEMHGAPAIAAACELCADNYRALYNRLTEALVGRNKRIAVKEG